MSALTVSAVIAVRDGEVFIADAIDSMLSQSIVPNEVIVVDDGSTDATVDVVARYSEHVRIVQQPAANQSTALNRGIAEACSDLLAFCDADDMWAPRKVERQLEVLDADPDLLLVSGLVEQFVSPGAEDATRGVAVDTTPQAAALPGTLLARREVFDIVGQYDEVLHLQSGVEWMSRARTLDVRVETIDSVVLRRRVHGRNVSMTQRDQKTRDMLTVIRAHWQRRRERAAEG